MFFTMLFADFFYYAIAVPLVYIADFYTINARQIKINEIII